MESWAKTSALLCIFGFLKEFRPAEPYYTKYLSGPPLNYSLDDISNNIYPISVYSTMASLVFVFLLTDFVRYKPVIIFDAVAATAVSLLIILISSYFAIQLAEFCYGLYMAGEVAYYTYIYAKVDKSHYQEVSGHTKAAYLLGRGTSGLLGQLCITFKLLNYYTLNFLTLGGVVSATIWACFLPPVTTSLYFNRNEVADHEKRSQSQIEIVFNADSETKVEEPKFRACLKYLGNDFIAAFSNLYVVKWILWSALATCGYFQVLWNYQVLWEQVLKDSNSTVNSEWNGAAETILTFLSAGTSYLVGRISVDWTKHGETTLFICSTLLTVILFLMSRTKEILFANASYVLLSVLYHGMSTIANSEIAKNIKLDSHGLIFGFTTFLSFLFQSTSAFVVNSTLSLNQRAQFMVYSSYFGVLGLVFGTIAVFKLIKQFLSNK